MLALLALGASCEGHLYDDLQDAGDDGGLLCSPACPDGWLCARGQCLSPEDPCFSVSCTAGSRCEAGACVADDLCAGITCSNPGDACQNGVCISGGADNDHDGFLAREDCDDFDPTVHPGAQDLCDGRDEDCDAATDDGHDECAGRCCGEPPTCSDCCADADCGPGGWQCTAGFCACLGVLCGETCHAGGVCCSPADCGTGEWTCDDHQCNCPGTITP